MLKNITEKESAILSLLRGSEELTSAFNNLCVDEDTRKLIINLTKDEIKFINSITSNLSLRQEIDKLGYTTILDYLEKKGFVNLLSLFNRLESILQNNYKNISRIEDIFIYIEFLLNGDMIKEAIEGKKITDKAKTSLLSLKREVFEEELGSLIKEIDGKKKENETLSRNNNVLQSVNNALSHSVEQLRCTRSSLLDENISLRQQIEDNRIVLRTKLDDEIEAERLRRISVIDEEMNRLRESEREKVSTINDEIEKASNELIEINAVMKEYAKDYPLAVGNEEYDVVWETINDDSDLMDIKMGLREKYYNLVVDKYRRMTGKTEAEAAYDFEVLHPELHTFTIMDCGLNNGRTVKEYLEKVLSEYAVTQIAKIKVDTINSVKIPTYIKKKRVANQESNIDKLMFIVNANRQIARAVSDKLVAEKTLETLLSTFLNYLSEEDRMKFMDRLTDNLNIRENSLVKKLIPPTGK